MTNVPFIKGIGDVEAVDILHQVSAFYMSTRVPQDYGTGELYTSTEVHLLKYIAEHDNVTVTSLSYTYGRTKGAISQLLSKLTGKGLIERLPSSSAPGNGNSQPLQITDKGMRLNEAHKAYDAVHFAESMSRVREAFSQEDIDTTFAVLTYWLSVRRDVQRQRVARRSSSSSSS
ncbi:MarR family winged helix-turn-helix transcriptional regulator [Thermophilibacter immobilis]|uniref:MarR family transcriptional regulator n=1 Tax=Thermophilibacter immobilis TaxID=2779519 RepID=A0A7S7RUQ8_9ACTN|nr:MarR family transcriptional regulator [Thermophilibacter immobilis]QOY60870.1 MarR family transcriptional regulator [Thermophilibacter immobilis]